jgi:glycosyltransferase involved in cell wall biosynthesis
MKRLLWIGSPFFSPALPACGWELCAINFEELAVFTWSDLVARAGWEPDVLVVADKSRLPFVLGVEDMPCLTVVYCVDTHIHSWLPLYAQAFDLCLARPRDHLQRFADKALTEEQVRWFPPFAKDDDRPGPPEEEWDCLFVGTINADKTPKRMDFLRDLRVLTPGLHAVRGDYRRLFPRGRVAINHCEAGDLNFRVFEALGCGACLLTPRIGHGLLDLFKDGVHLVAYEPDDVRDAARHIRELLANPLRRSLLRTAGLAAIDAGHRARHRAEELSRLLRAYPRARVQERRQRAARIREQWLRIIYLHMAEAEAHPLMRETYLKAAQGALQ